MKENLLKRMHFFLIRAYGYISFYRYSTLHFNDYVSGAKSCIEQIAVYAATQEEMCTEISYLRCFKRFIKYLRNFDALNVQIMHFSKKVRKAVDKNRPRVIDPVNPYNNLARNWNPKSIEWVKFYANGTKQRLDFLGSRGSIDFRLLFEPQSAGSTSNNCGTFLPDLKIHNDAKTDQIKHCGWVWKI